MNRRSRLLAVPEVSPARPLPRGTPVRSVTRAGVRLTALSVVVLSACSTTAPGPGPGDQRDRAATGSDRAAGSSASPSTTQAEGPLTSLSARAIADRAIAANRDAGSLSVRGRTVQEGADTSFDIAFDIRGRCEGTLITKGQGNVDFIIDNGTTHLRLDEQATRGRFEGEPATEVERAVEQEANRWLELAADDTGSEQFRDFCDINAFISRIEDRTAGARKGEKTVVAGRPALSLVMEDVDKKPVVLHVATQGPPYLLKVEKTSGRSPGVFTFGGFGRPVPTGPPADEGPPDTTDGG